MSACSSRLAGRRSIWQLNDSNILIFKKVNCNGRNGKNLFLSFCNKQADSHHQSSSVSLWPKTDQLHLVFHQIFFISTGCIQSSTLRGGSWAAQPNPQISVFRLHDGSAIYIWKCFTAFPALFLVSLIGNIWRTLAAQCIKNTQITSEAT